MPFSRRRPVDQNISSTLLSNLFLTSDQGRQPSTMLLTKSYDIQSSISKDLDGHLFNMDLLDVTPKIRFEPHPHQIKPDHHSPYQQMQLASSQLRKQDAKLLLLPAWMKKRRSETVCSSDLHGNSLDINSVVSSCSYSNQKFNRYA